MTFVDPQMKKVKDAEDQALRKLTERLELRDATRILDDDLSVDDG